MRKITLTIELEDDEAAWLERWRAYSPAPPHPALTLEQKVAACVFHVWNIEEQREQTADMAADIAADNRRAMN